MSAEEVVAVCPAEVAAAGRRRVAHYPSRDLDGHSGKMGPLSSKGNVQRRCHL